MSSLFGEFFSCSSWSYDLAKILLRIAIVPVALMVIPRLVSEMPQYPRNLKAITQTRKPLDALRSRLKAWGFLFRGTKIIQDEFERANGAAFVVDVPENRYHIVSSWDHIKEIDAAPDGVLSLQGAAKEILQPRHTMTNFNWLDKRGADGAPLLKTLRTDLTGHLPGVLPEIRRAMSGLLDKVHDSHRTINGTKQSPLYPMVIKAITKSNALAFFGEDIARNEEFMKVGSAFIEQTLIIAEVCRLLPDALSNHIGKLLSSSLNSGKIIHSILDPVVEQRFEERARQKLGYEVPNHTGCFALFDLCLHPEYISPLRDEIERTGWEEFDQSQGKLFPLMDSFMKESARLTPVES
ncbi:hypothetical protein diail_9512, partial [Diaporthe ilicicola]